MRAYSTRRLTLTPAQRFVGRGGHRKHGSAPRPTRSTAGSALRLHLPAGRDPAANSSRPLLQGDGGTFHAHWRRRRQMHARTPLPPTNSVRAASPAQPALRTSHADKFRRSNFGARSGPRPDPRRRRAPRGEGSKPCAFERGERGGAREGRRKGRGRCLAADQEPSGSVKPKRPPVGLAPPRHACRRDGRGGQQQTPREGCWRSWKEEGGGHEASMARSHLI